MISAHSTLGSAHSPPRRELYPAIEPYRHGYLRVSELHEIYYEESVNPAGKAAIFLHGGPGAGSDKRAQKIRTLLVEGLGVSADAVKAANAEGLRVRLVSMPCTEVFDAQDEAYRESVLPKAVRARVAVEAGATLGWWKYVGLDGRILGIDRFGASGKVQDLFPHFGFTADNVWRLIRETIG